MKEVLSHNSVEELFTHVDFKRNKIIKGILKKNHILYIYIIREYLNIILNELKPILSVHINIRVPGGSMS